MMPMYGVQPSLGYPLPAALPPYNYLNYIPHHPIYAERLQPGQFPMHPLMPMSAPGAVVMSEANMAHYGGVAPRNFAYYTAQMGALSPPSMYGHALEGRAAAQLGNSETHHSDGQETGGLLKGASSPLLRNSNGNRLSGVLSDGCDIVIPRSVVDAALPPASTPLALDGMGEGVDPETLTTVHSFLVGALRRKRGWPGRVRQKSSA